LSETTIDATGLEYEIIAWINRNSSNTSYDFESVAGDFYYDLENGEVIELPSGKAKMVAQTEESYVVQDYWIVFSIGSQLFRFSGYYSSWDGTSWDGANLEEVVSKEVTVTQFVTK
jgi:hypothetical protein